MPRMPDIELEEVIGSEIEKMPAFAAKEFEFGYYRYPTSSIKLQVIYSVIPKEIVTAIQAAARALKLPLEFVEASPLNILGFAASLSKGAEEAFVVVDDKVSYVMVMSKNQCRFFYSCGVGLLDLGASQDTASRSQAYGAWAGEIKRILKSYMLEFKTDPKRVWLAWDQESVTDLVLSLGKELGKEVKALDLVSASGVSLGALKSISCAYVVCCVPILNYCKHLSRGFPTVRLLRGDIAKKFQAQLIRVALMYAVGVAVVAGIVGLVFKVQQSNISRNLAQVNADIARAESVTAQYRVEKNKYLETKKMLLAQATTIKFLNRVSWSRVFGEAAEELPEGICLTSFKVSGSQRVEFKGDAFKIEDVSSLMRKIDATTVLTNPKFDFLRENNIEQKKIFSFGIFADVVREYAEKPVQK